MASHTSTFTISTTDFNKYLNHVDPQLRNHVVSCLTQSLQQLLVAGHTSQGDENVSNTVPTHISTNDQYKTVVYALIIIGYDDITTVDPGRKELITLAKKFINRQIDHFDEQALKWLSDNFTELATSSAESKAMFKKVYHKMLEDLQHISQTKKELIIKFVNEGITTSLTRKGEIILEGKRYKIQDQNMQPLLLEEIAKAVINQDSDILAKQYRDYKPIFPKSEGIGMRKATCDIEHLTSILSKNYTLTTHQWMLTSLIPERSEATNLDGTKPEILLLEQRNSMGDHSTLVLNSDLKPQFRPEFNRSDREHNKQMLQTIFGVYKEKTVYNARTKMLSDEEGRRIATLNNREKLTFAQIEGEFEGTQKYFQQELFHLGHEDRLAYIDTELMQKVTDNTKALQRMLDSCKPTLKSEEQEKLREYYSAFLLTFSSLYTASQAVDSGQLCVDTSNLTTTILSTLASFAPFGIGDALSSGINQINDFITGTKMANEAKLIKKLAADAVELSSVVGDVGLKVVENKTLQKRILSSTVEDPSGIMGKLRVFITTNKDKLANYNLAEKELHKTPAAALGENDANTLIQEWLSQIQAKAKEFAANKAQGKEGVVHPTKFDLYLGMSNGDLKAEFLRLISGETLSEDNDKSPHKSPNKKGSKINPEATTKGNDNPKKRNNDNDDDDDAPNYTYKSSCCEIFVAEIRYTNPLLNNMDLIHQLAKQIPFRQIIEASHRLMTNGHTILLCEVTNSGDINLLKETLMAALSSCDWV